MRVTKRQLRRIIRGSYEKQRRLNEDLGSFLTLGLAKAVIVLLAHYGLKRSEEKADALRDIADKIEAAEI